MATKNLRTATDNAQFWLHLADEYERQAKKPNSAPRLAELTKRAAEARACAATYTTDSHAQVR